MSLKELVQNNLKLTSSKIYFDEPMSKHTTFKIGGPAEVFIKVGEIEDLKQILNFTNKNNIPLTIMGNGSNVLVLDSGIKGITAKIEIQTFWDTPQKPGQIGENIEITVGAGEKNIEIAQKLLKLELTGFEEIAGIPGTIGGAIRMNAGAHGREIKDIVKSVLVMDYNGNIKQMQNEDLQFEYRNSILSKEKLIVLEATLVFQKGNKEEIQNKMKEYQAWRREKQPLEYPNAGSTFKRGDGFITAQLIDECGLKGYNVGGAEISTKHAGFVVNKGGATAQDVIDLTNYIKEKVFEKFNKHIELEIEILGG
ncbi:MAG: UDP-N-acetylmuramate dehydrogenase [Clostridia bacterium]|nr:UDP-N-acetylmuramate dehydrogenase [Clostridia bacterium]